MKPMTIYIDKYLGGDIAKLVVFHFLCTRARYSHSIKSRVGGWVGGGEGGEVHYTTIKSMRGPMLYNRVWGLGGGGVCVVVWCGGWGEGHRFFFIIFISYFEKARNMI